MSHNAVSPHAPRLSLFRPPRHVPALARRRVSWYGARCVLMGPLITALFTGGGSLIWYGVSWTTPRHPVRRYPLNDVTSSCRSGGNPAVTLNSTFSALVSARPPEPLSSRACTRRLLARINIEYEHARGRIMASMHVLCRYGLVRSGLVLLLLLPGCAGLFGKMPTIAPSLKTPSTALEASPDTFLGRAVTPLAAAHPGRSGFYLLPTASRRWRHGCYSLSEPSAVLICSTISSMPISRGTYLSSTSSKRPIAGCECACCSMT